MVSDQKPLEKSETKISENDDDCLIVTGASNGADEPDSSDDEEKSTKSKKSSKSLKIPLWCCKHDNNNTTNRSIPLPEKVQECIQPHQVEGIRKYFFSTFIKNLASFVNLASFASLN